MSVFITPDRPAAAFENQRDGNHSIKRNLIAGQAGSLPPLPQSLTRWKLARNRGRGEPLRIVLIKLGSPLPHDFRGADSSITHDSVAKILGERGRG
ncbi:hypothetical protein Pla52n_41490 [Stieleria varia]|uniref:Uncharacterized protein n=1 Tax=Stieleria varia TaxID=2528005 RepID=A0A5C6AM96_9BACT|nr:hypothetical protein Pla52n_41490 [Stieleria varia]